MQSVVIDTAMTDNLNYIFQTDYLDTEDPTGARARNTFGINQYLIYGISDCWAAGLRAEWWNVATEQFGAGSGNTDVYSLTGGLNYRPHANVLIRPEIRWDWIKEDAADLDAAGVTFNEGNKSSQAAFGVDTIFLF